MKANHWVHSLSSVAAWVGWAIVSATTPGEAAPASLLTPRTNINPAILYWQAFGAYPTASDNFRTEFLAEPPRLSVEEAEEASAKLDATFRLLRRAARMQAPCDWGMDSSDGPSAGVPTLVKVRRCAQAGQARAHYALEGGRDEDAVEDLAAVLALGRNVGIPASLVTTMIGIAVEGLVINFTAKNFYRFSPSALKELMNRIEAAPPRTSVKQAMLTEQTLFWEWFIARIEALRDSSVDDQGRLDDRRAVEAARELLRSELNDGEMVDRIVVKSGETTAGLIAYFKELGPLYQQVQRLAAAGPDVLEDETQAFSAALEKNPNLIAGMIFPNVRKARQTELRVIAHLAMLRAAFVLRAKGEEAFQKVPDPFGEGPFTLRRIAPGDDVAEGEGGGGFELSSGLESYGIRAPLKFFENPPASADSKAPVK